MVQITNHEPQPQLIQMRFALWEPVEPNQFKPIQRFSILLSCSSFYQRVHIRSHFTMITIYVAIAKLKCSFRCLSRELISFVSSHTLVILVDNCSLEKQNTWATAAEFKFNQLCWFVVFTAVIYLGLEFSIKRKLVHLGENINISEVWQDYYP